MTLTEFLLARIAEDEAVARRCNTGPPIVLALQVGMDHHEGVENGWVEVDAGRVLAECEAKRRIVADHPHVFREGDGNLVADEWACQRCMNERYWCPTLRSLAAIYAEHPDYREAWRP